MAASLTTQERDIKIIMDTLSSMRSANNNPTPEIKKIRSDRLTDPDPSSQPIKPWLQEPTLRPDMHTFLTQLANLHKLYCSPRIIPHDKSQNSNNTAAFHENPTALYNLGSIYYEGKLNLQVDHKLGIKFYKKAALKGHDKSIQRLSSLKISVYDD
ncbi:13142_t:CDS:2 [Entrophospora sp. SA101]|nr:1332_t:CDS:2 [Entrophospora sp. SA101]CAJ0831575.1 13142_t:CDS:2 [Entrophospora sp. SA101]